MAALWGSIQPPEDGPGGEAGVSAGGWQPGHAEQHPLLREPRNSVLRFCRRLLLPFGNVPASASEPGALRDVAVLLSLFLTAVVVLFGVPGKPQVSLEVKSVLSSKMTTRSIPASYHHCF